MLKLQIEKAKSKATATELHRRDREHEAFGVPEEEAQPKKVCRHRIARVVSNLTQQQRQRKVDEFGRDLGSMDDIGKGRRQRYREERAKAKEERRTALKQARALDLFADEPDGWSSDEDDELGTSHDRHVRVAMGHFRPVHDPRV